jgi:hypothetical protein
VQALPVRREYLAPGGNDGDEALKQPQPDRFGDTPRQAIAINNSTFFLVPAQVVL